MRYAIFALTLGAIVVCGCRLSNRYRVRDTLATLPNGGEIYVDVEHRASPLGARAKAPLKGPLAIWKRPGQDEKVLTTLIPAPGSPAGLWWSDGGMWHAEVHVSDDSNRVWLVKDDQVVASFDYVTNTAVLGLSGQPLWTQNRTE